MSALMDALLGLGSGALDVLDMPGSYFRGLLGGRLGERLSGEEMLEEWGVDDPGMVAGMGAELIADPLNALGGVKLLKMLKARKPNIPVSVVSKMDDPDFFPVGSLPRQVEQIEGGYSLAKAMSDGKEVGRVGLMPPSASEYGMATRGFPGLVPEGTKVARVEGSMLDDSLHGRGIGQQMYVDAMKTSPADWFYNSGNSDEATRALEALRKKELIELHWQRKLGGPKLMRLTERGRDAAGTNSLIRDVENPSLSPLLAALLGYNTANMVN